jgi:hypothetical protein
VAEQEEHDDPEDGFDKPLPEIPKADITRWIILSPQEGQDSFVPSDPNDTSSSNLLPHLSQENS